MGSSFIVSVFFWLTLALALLIAAALAIAQTSPEGTRSPPAPEIVDSKGYHWKIQVNTGIPNTLDGVSLLVICKDVVYARTSNDWKFWNGSAWISVGTQDPCAQ